MLPICSFFLNRYLIFTQILAVHYLTRLLCYCNKIPTANVSQIKCNKMYSPVIILFRWLNNVIHQPSSD